MSFCFEIHETPPAQIVETESSDPSVTAASGYLALAHCLELSQTTFNTTYRKEEPQETARGFSVLTWATVACAEASGRQLPQGTHTSLAAIAADALRANGMAIGESVSLNGSPGLADIIHTDVSGYRPVLGSTYAGLPAVRTRSRAVEELTCPQLFAAARRYGNESIGLLRDTAAAAYPSSDPAARTRLLNATLANAWLLTLGVVQRYHSETLGDVAAMSTKLIQSFEPTSNAAPDV